MKNIKFLILWILLLLAVACSKDENKATISSSSSPTELTIFYINDVHGQLDYFPKVKYIIDLERETNPVLVLSAGDLFSGNPVVDNYSEKGFPIIDVMNRIGFDASSLGNHEFDYGLEVLDKRMEQSDFYWLCANVDMQNSGVSEPFEYKTIHKGDVQISLLGLIETNGKDEDTIPSTHPWKVSQIRFDRPQDIASDYADIKETEGSDIYIALSHLGYDGNDEELGDVQLANQFPYFDLIIGGHSHSTIATTVNGIPIYQAGSNLNYLGKISLQIVDKNIDAIDYELIDLNAYSDFDSDLQKLIDEYNNEAYLDEVIGYSNRYHNYSQVGCFCTDALRKQMDVDVCFQNTGGIRSPLNQGDITQREIYEIIPFSNGTIIYEMSVLEIKTFLGGSAAGFYYSGIEIEMDDQEIKIKNQLGQTLADEQILTVGLNDYIPAVYDIYFPESGQTQGMTDAETVIVYLQENKEALDYSVCDRYFRME